MNDGFLHKYFLNNASRCIHKTNHYFDIYERHFSRFLGKSPTMIEIGVGLGGSLQMWKAYFGPSSQIIGIDINPKCDEYAEEGIKIIIGSQDDSRVINDIFSAYPRIDIVLDDGSHQMRHMITLFELMYDRLQPSGIYMVEDTHTCYWDKYEGGLRREGSFIEFTKQKLDEINAVYTEGTLPITEFTRFTDSISCYASAVVFERRKQSVKQGMSTEGM